MDNQNINILHISDEMVDDLLDMINKPESYNIRTVSGKKTDGGVKITLIQNDESIRIITLNFQKRKM